jgi:aspartyl-tRNA(Asn)/glutamyl-tRNA(Gln) amidotransferase subunit A
VDRLFELAGLEGDAGERSRLEDDVASILHSWRVLESEVAGDEPLASPLAPEPRRAEDRVDPATAIELPRPERLHETAGTEGIVHSYLEAGEAGGPLQELRYATKANIAVRGRVHDCCSRLLEGYISPYDATVTARLRAAGATLVGATNMDEFAMGSSTWHSVHGPTRHPLDGDRSVGGSSGGSAAVVAAAQVPFALGSDTGGSVRQPAACCGVYGLRPTWGRVSRHGLTAFASSMDQIGVLARELEVLERVFAVIEGVDPHDSTTHAHRAGGRRARRDGRGRLAVDRTLLDFVDDAVRQRFEEGLDRLRSAGIEVSRVELASNARALESYHVLSSVEAASNLARFDGSLYGRREGGEDYPTSVRATRSAGFGLEVKRRILMGVFGATDVEGRAQQLRARALRWRIREDYLRVLQDCDAVLSPTLPTGVPPARRPEGSATAELQRDRLTAPASLAGLPALVLPVPGPGPIADSWQLVGAVDAEEHLFELARVCRGLWS